MRIIEELKKLNGIDDGVSEALPAQIKREVGPADDDLNAKILRKINVLASALAAAFEREGIDLDANLVADDIRRDCGLMGGVVGTDALDAENNPFDAATKQMHDMGPVDTEEACRTLLEVPTHEFVKVFVDGLKRGRGLLPGGPHGMLPGPRGAIPMRRRGGMLPPPRRRIGEGEEKEPSGYIAKLIRKYSRMLKESASLVEKITDLKAYYNSKNNKDRFAKANITEEDFLKLADVDPTHKQGTNGGGTYIEWLLRLVMSGTETMEGLLRSANEYRDQLSAYEDLKKRKRLPEAKRDIMQIKSLNELIDVVANRGEEPEQAAAEGGEAEGQEAGGKEGGSGSMSDFKQDLRNFPELCQKLTWPDAVTDSYDKHLELVGENPKWEIWKIKSPLGAFVMDQYGDGAKWCVGGFGYKGREGKRSAESYYNNYLNGGEGVYVCFQQKNKNAKRPYNKGLITFDDAARTSVSQFNHSNNSSWYNDTHSSDNTVEEFARFLAEEDLTGALRGTEFGNCESVKIADQLAKLKAGEPYVYDGTPIKSLFYGTVKNIVFSDDYHRQVRDAGGGQTYIGVPHMAFSRLKELESVHIPNSVQYIGMASFPDNENLKIYIASDAHIKVASDMFELVQKHAVDE